MRDPQQTHQDVKPENERKNAYDVARLESQRIASLHALMLSQTCARCEPAVRSIASKTLTFGRLSRETRSFFGHVMVTAKGIRCLQHPVDGLRSTTSTPTGSSRCSRSWTDVDWSTSGSMRRRTLTILPKARRRTHSFSIGRAHPRICVAMAR